MNGIQTGIICAAFAANCATAAGGLFDGAEWIGEAPGMNAAAPRWRRSTSGKERDDRNETTGNKQ